VIAGHKTESHWRRCFPGFQSQENKMVDQNRVEGIGHQIKGSIKEAVGKVTGDTKTQAEGTAEKAAGKAQNAVGGAADAVRDAVKK
jgi:uncharacterized protein YjbJ (UPF0337 family)